MSPYEEILLAFWLAFIGSSPIFFTFNDFAKSERFSGVYWSFISILCLGILATIIWVALEAPWILKLR